MAVLSTEQWSQECPCPDPCHLRLGDHVAHERRFASGLRCWWHDLNTWPTQLIEEKLIPLTSSESSLHPHLVPRAWTEEHPNNGNIKQRRTHFVGEQETDGMTWAGGSSGTPKACSQGPTSSSQVFSPKASTVSHSAIIWDPRIQLMNLCRVLHLLLTMAPTVPNETTDTLKTRDERRHQIQKKHEGQWRGRGDSGYEDSTHFSCPKCRQKGHKSRYGWPLETENGPTGSSKGTGPQPHKDLILLTIWTSKESGFTLGSHQRGTAQPAPWF